MPSDLIYHTYVDADGKPKVAPGPLLKHGEALATFFFNEINRARPQMHSLMLRVMAERSVSAFNREYQFPHLQVIADRNRVEIEETFEVPAAARDRFLMESEIRSPTDPDLLRQLMVDTRFHDTEQLLNQVPAQIVDYRELNGISAAIQSHILTSEAIEKYALNLCRATTDPGEFGITLSDTDMTRLIQAGVSPRGMSYLLRAARVAAWLNGRQSVLPEDIHEVFFAVVAHRVFFRPAFELRRGELAGVDICTAQRRFNIGLPGAPYRAIRAVIRVSSVAAGTKSTPPRPCMPAIRGGSTCALRFEIRLHSCAFARSSSAASYRFWHSSMCLLR